MNAFGANGVTLSAAAKITAKDEFNNWVIHDTAQTYVVVPKIGGLDVSVLRQTHLTADELSANPEYVNTKAYDVLRKAVYPSALPFDLFTEEVRAYLGAMNVQRALLMETFRGPGAPNKPTDLDIAAEYMAVAKFEQDLIFKADPANQFKYWGTVNNAGAVAAMTQVDKFLDATRLEYVDLQRLLTLAFINPGNVIDINNLDSSCDPAQKRLQPLDANALDQFHRFLRLWRRLGWQMWEVDLAIQTLGGGTLDGNFATALYPFLQVKDRLKLSVEQLCAFFKPISTVSKFTASYQKPTPSLYESLFLNKKLTNPLDPAFSIAASKAAGDVIDNHVAPILAATK